MENHKQVKHSHSKVRAYHSKVLPRNRVKALAVSPKETDKRTEAMQ